MKNISARALLASVAVCLAPATQAEVVINEIFYNAPNDLSDLEFVELLNTGAESVKLSGWELGEGIEFVFPSSCIIEPGGFVVVCKDAKLFQRFYGDVAFVGAYQKSLGNGKDTISLENAEGEVVDLVKYSDESPWPVSPDGYSASLERICPTAEDDTAANWAPSVLSDDYDSKPAGTPGAVNSVHQESLPPLMEGLESSSPEVCPPGTAIEVAVTVKGASTVTLRYQVVIPGSAAEEVEVPMQEAGDGKYRGSIPGQETGKIVRYRVCATGEDGATRVIPHENDIRPAHSVYVSESVASGAIPVVQFFNVGKDEFEVGADYQEDVKRPARGGPGGFGPGGRGEFRRGPDTAEERARREDERARRDAERLLREDALENAWVALTLKPSMEEELLAKVRMPFQAARRELTGLRDGLLSEEDARAAAGAIPGALAKLGDRLRAGCDGILDDEQQGILSEIGVSREDDRDRRGPGGPGRGFDRGSMMQRFLNLEQTWFRISMNEEVESAALGELREIMLGAIEKRDGITIEGREGGRPDFGAVMEVVEEQRGALDAKLEESLGKAVFAKLDLERGGFGFGGRNSRGANPSRPLLPQGRSALVYTAPNSGQTRLFDFINITPRKSGFKVRLHKEKMLDGLKTINVLFEHDERTCVNEPLAYDLYRAAGNVTPRAGFLRLMVDGNLVGYHHWFEQVNGSFLRHNEVNDKGDLYKVTWQGSSGASEFTPEELRPDRKLDVVRRYDKKSNPHEGYEKLVELVEALEEAEGEDEKLWKVIEEHFDVENVVNYFAANSLLSHWDGFFNNYYLYRDNKRKKWMMFPFDQDSTWSQRMGDVASLSRMPLNFGSAEAVRGGFGRGGQSWWRDGGEISKPLLANPKFKMRFLARLKELAETVFNDEEFGARISKAEDLLSVEVALRAKARGVDEKSAVDSLNGIMDGLREHLKARREFVLSELSSSEDPSPSPTTDSGR